MLLFIYLQPVISSKNRIWVDIGLLEGVFKQVLINIDKFFPNSMIILMAKTHLWFSKIDDNIYGWNQTWNNRIDKIKELKKN